jgi:hypothetical protein
MISPIRSLFRPAPGQAVIVLIRLAVGLIFSTQGYLKYIDPNMGVVRFTRIGFPHSYFTAHFVGAIEITCGGLVLFGFWVRAAGIPLLIVPFRQGAVDRTISFPMGVLTLHAKRCDSGAADETIGMMFAKDNAAEEGFDRWTINGSAYPMSSEPRTASFHLEEGKRYRIRMRNASDDIDPIHLHRYSFELTSMAGIPTAGSSKTS